MAESDPLNADDLHAEADAAWQALPCVRPDRAWSVALGLSQWTPAEAAHLRQCPRCREIVQRISATAASSPAAAPVFHFEPAHRLAAAEDAPAAVLTQSAGGFDVQLSIEPAEILCEFSSLAASAPLLVRYLLTESTNPASAFAAGLAALLPSATGALRTGRFRAPLDRDAPIAALDLSLEPIGPGNIATVEAAALRELIDSTPDDDIRRQLTALADRPTP